MKKKNLNKVWDKIFPYIPKLGDKVRLPYGKVDWEVFIIYQEGLIKLRRHPRSRFSYQKGKWHPLPWWTTLTVDKRQEMKKVGHI